MSFLDDIFGNPNSAPSVPASWNSPLRDAEPSASAPQAYGGMFGLGPLSWTQRAGLLFSALGDAANNARGLPSNGFGNAVASLRDANQRRALAGTPFTGDANNYVSRLASLGVPLDVALRMGAGFRSLQNARTLSPDEAAQKGYRQGAVVEEQPGGEEQIVQPSDVKSPEAVAQEFAIASGMPVTQAQQDKFDIQRGRWGIPQPAPQRAATSPAGRPTPYIPTLTRPEDVLGLRRGSYFRTPGGQLKQVP
jgi:hypothetical protein